jgi:hypothetical protein
MNKQKGMRMRNTAKKLLFIFIIPLIFPVIAIDDDFNITNNPYFHESSASVFSHNVPFQIISAACYFFFPRYFQNSSSRRSLESYFPKVRGPGGALEYYVGDRKIPADLLQWENYSSDIFRWRLRHCDHDQEDLLYVYQYVMEHDDFRRALQQQYPKEYQCFVDTVKDIYSDRERQYQQFQERFESQQKIWKQQAEEQSRILREQNKIYEDILASQVSKFDFNIDGKRYHEHDCFVQTTKNYNLTNTTQSFLKSNSLLSSHYQTFVGSEIQHVLHSQIIEGLEKLAALSSQNLELQKKTNNTDVPVPSQMVHEAALTYDSARITNTCGDVKSTIKLIDLASVITEWTEVI